MCLSDYIGFIYQISDEIKLISQEDIAGLKSAEALKGVEVNDKWLEKTGFSFLVGSTEYQTFSRDGVYVILSDHSTKFLNQKGEVQEFEFMHQLQTIFLAATQKKLEIQEANTEDDNLPHRNEHDNLEKIRVFQSLNIENLKPGQ